MRKLDAYRRGRYKIAPPTVPHYLWGDADWISYIDACGGWLVDVD